MSVYSSLDNFKFVRIIKINSNYAKLFKHNYFLNIITMLLSILLVKKLLIIMVIKNKTNNFNFQIYKYFYK